MSIRTTVFVLLIFLVAFHTFIYAQNNSELSTLGDRIVNGIQSQKPDWKYERVQPIADSADVMLQQWTLDNCSIRIAIISHKSIPDADAAISKLAQEGQVNERFQGLGDDGMMWGRGVVSFRKRNITIDVSATSTNSTLDLNETGKNTADERKLAKEFARLVADAIKDKQ